MGLARGHKKILAGVGCTFMKHGTRYSNQISLCNCRSWYILLAGRSGLAVACLTAVCEVLGSNRTVGSCVYRKNHYDLQPWARAVHTFLQCLGQLSLLPCVGLLMSISFRTE